MKTTNLVIAACVAALVLPTAGAILGLPSATSAKTTASVVVLVADYSFTPATLNIAAGTTVTWKNVGTMDHEAECHYKVAEGTEPSTCSGGDFEGEMTAPGAGVDPSETQFSYTFVNPGVYLINCNKDGNMHQTMKNVIVVS